MIIIIKSELLYQRKELQQRVVTQSNESLVTFPPLVVTQGNLQFTLEEKYLNKQQKYFFECGEDRFLLLPQDLRLIHLHLGHDTPVLRRPIFSSPPDKGAAAPVM